MLCSRLDGIEIPWVWRLGDFTPWNVFLDRKKQKIYVIDVEYAAPCAVPGWDIFHHFAQTCRNYREQHQAIYHTNRHLIEAYFRSLRIGADYVPYLHLAYAIDLWMMWQNIWTEAGDTKTERAIREFRQRINMISILVRQLEESTQP